MVCLFHLSPSLNLVLSAMSDGRPHGARQSAGSVESGRTAARYVDLPYCAPSHPSARLAKAPVFIRCEITTFDLGEQVPHCPSRTALFLLLTKGRLGAHFT